MKISNKTMSATIAASTTSIQKLLAFCLLIMLFSSFEAKADLSEDCNEGQCGPLSTYTSYDQKSVTGGINGCYYEVNYERKFEVCNGDTIFYYKIVSIDYYNNPSCDDNVVMKDAIRQLLAYAWANFGLNPLLGNTIRVVMPSCFSREYIDGVYKLVNCGVVCCKAEYYLPNITSLGSTNLLNTISANCSSITFNNCRFNCNNRNLPEGPLYKFTTPNCSVCSWNPLQSFKTTYSGVQMEIFYQTSNCQGVRSYRIDRIRIDGIQATNVDAVKYAKGKLLRHSGTLMNPAPNSGSPIYFYLSPCWEMQTSGTKYLYLPCSSSSNCCITTYTVSNSTDGGFTWNTGTYTSSNPDNNIVNCASPGLCEDICNATVTMNSPLPKLGANNSEDGNELEKFNVKSTVVPNPSKDKCDISLTLENPGALKLLVFDNNGREVTELTMANTSSKEVSFNLNTKNFSVGNYQYIITQNDKIISKGNIMIQK